jgi:hypothetical protein
MSALYICVAAGRTQQKSPALWVSRAEVAPRSRYGTMALHHVAVDSCRR